MNLPVQWPIVAGFVGLFVLLSAQQSPREVAAAQTRKRVFITRLYTGPDGLSYAEEIEADFTPGKSNDISKLMKITGAELHRSAPGHVADWHVAPRRQYVITLSGRAELELSGGKKISVGPGSIELAEDLTGKGHITRVIGNEDRIALFLPLADQTVR